MEQLTAEIKRLYGSVHISETAEEGRRRVATELQDAFRREQGWSHCEVFLVGSSMSKFGFNGSDLDLSLCRELVSHEEGGLEAMTTEFNMRNAVFRKRQDDNYDDHEETMKGTTDDPIALNRMLATALQSRDSAIRQWHRSFHETQVTQSRLVARIAHWEGLVAALHCAFQPFPEPPFSPAYWAPSDQPPTFTPNGELEILRMRRRYDLDVTSERLRRFGCEVHEVVSGARVPVIKFTYRAATFQCDLCLENYDSYLNTQLLRTYAEFDERARVLGIAVKHWAKQRGLNDASSNHLSSYSFVLLTIFFLQTKAKILPNLQHPELRRKANVAPIVLDGIDVSFCRDLQQARAFHLTQNPEPSSQSVGELLLGFFQFYVEEFDFIEHAVIVRRPERQLSKAVYWGGKSNVKAWRISIVDPVDVGRDLSDLLFFWSQVRLFKEMKRALVLLRNGESFEKNVCEGMQSKT